LLACHGGQIDMDVMEQSQSRYRIHSDSYYSVKIE